LKKAAFNPYIQGSAFFGQPKTLGAPPSPRFLPLRWDTMNTELVMRKILTP